jgi:hypothetical protein
MVVRGLYFASINYWTKGLVEEKDLRIPNMRGMTARSKALTIVEPIDAPVNTKAVKFEKPHLGLLYI